MKEKNKRQMVNHFEYHHEITRKGSLLKLLVFFAEINFYIKFNTKKHGLKLFSMH